MALKIQSISTVQTFQLICGSSYFLLYKLLNMGERIDPPCLVNEGHQVTVSEARYRIKVLGFALREAFYAACVFFPRGSRILLPFSHKEL